MPAVRRFYPAVTAGVACNLRPDLRDIARRVRVQDEIGVASVVGVHDDEPALVVGGIWRRPGECDLCGPVDARAGARIGPSRWCQTSLY
jgi:hypothetical protein